MVDCRVRPRIDVTKGEPATVKTRQQTIYRSNEMKRNGKNILDKDGTVYQENTRGTKAKATAL